MTTTSEAAPDHPSPDTTGDAPPGEHSLNVWLWSGIGCLALLVQAWIWVRYAASGPEQITRFRDTSQPSWVWAKLFETSQVLFLVVTVSKVTYDAVKRRRLTRNAMLLIAFVSVLWLDPLLNYLRPGFYFSSNFVNLESWNQFIPGSLAPHTNITPIPVLWVVGTYVGFFLPVILLVERIMQRLHRRWPTARLPVLMAAAFPVCFAFDLALELTALRTGTFAYPAAWHSWSIWGGETYQFPLIEGIAAPMFWLSMAAMVYSADPKTGVMPIERGASRISSPRAATGLRLLAVIGFTNVMFLLLPMGLPQIGVARTDPFPDGYAPDLHNGWCGDDGQPYGPCSGPGVSWKVRQGIDPDPDEVYEDFPYFQLEEQP